MFKPGQQVKHLKSGGIYEIIALPTEERLLEHNAQPFYEYKSIDTGVRWLRTQKEMEDGRFSPV
ncbi:hypothetical protein FKG94_23025 [Exilibacterium tricleocarpae]|uniref:DUF1653 domain-containing protein n=1 Tax=Exilibacterium tricleocarpae TaxID=2591008 RepID=A0A545SXJ7_9GAMM|nr:hypothetical protein [Exilibacterium tricleocarpae]TQV69669.1 hypothetical protein FKG94_23025 [Exilibacterium tricleocarpae]